MTATRIHLAWVFLVLVSSSCVESFFEETWEKSKEYFYDVLPYVKDFYHNVRRAQEFTDSIIDEDCDYNCPKGYVSKARKGYVQESNGCGALNMIFDHTDKSPIRLDKEFTPCCNEHDICYDTCNSDKDQCDLDFKRCLYSVCKTKTNELTEVKPCKANAKGAYLLVMALGCQLWKDSQKNACECVKKKISRQEL